MAAIAFAAIGPAVAADVSRTVAYTPRTDAFRNPGQGWSAFGTNVKTWDAVVNVGSGYDRFQWNQLEPEEGRYDWAPIDRCLAAFAKMGLPFAFRIMCANLHSSGRDCTPQWVFDKGAKGYVYEGLEYALPDGTKTKDKVAPWFGDPVFIACHRRFIEALAKRYDGDPRLHGIDLGSYGNWGEWHCYPLWPKGRRNEGSPGNPSEVRRQYVDMYLDNFRKTPVIFMTDDAPMLAYAEGKGTFRVGLRRDGVGDPKNIQWAGSKRYADTPQMGEVWKHRPVWFEWWGNGDKFGEKGTRFETWVIDKPVAWMLENHVSLVNTIPFNPQVFARKRPDLYPLIRDLDLKAGARFVAERAELTATADGFAVRLTGTNAGVARIHLPYRAEYVIAAAEGAAPVRVPSSFRPCEILPGAFAHEERVRLPAAAAPGARVALRLCHEHGIFLDFRWAVKETTPEGALDLGPIPAKP